ncbi:Uncharacterised protein [Klebsiella pneumoniae]|nr:Uncharacterised protein [Klebsiella pneumoniae]
MVSVAVGVDNGHNRFLWAVFEIEIKAGFCCIWRHQRVNDDDARIAFNEGDVRDILAAHLIHAVGDFKQARNAVDLRLTPQAWVNGFGRGRIDIKFIIFSAIIWFAISIAQNTFIQQRSDKSTLSIVKILTIAKR